MITRLVCRVLMHWFCCQVLIWDLRCWNNKERWQSDSPQSLELNKREEKSVPYTCTIKPLQELVGHEGSIYRISWSASGSHIASASDDRRYFSTGINSWYLSCSYVYSLNLKPIIHILLVMAVHEFGYHFLWIQSFLQLAQFYMGMEDASGIVILLIMWALSFIWSVKITRSDLLGEFTVWVFVMAILNNGGYNYRV